MTPQQLANKLLTFFDNKPERWTKGCRARAADGMGVQPEADEAVCWCAVGAIEKMEVWDSLAIAELGLALSKHGRITRFNDNCEDFEEFQTRLREVASNVQHSSRTDQWGTPPEYLEAVHEVLGGITLDAASSAHWNRTVGADSWLEDALSDELWSDKPENVYLNPPGGKLGNKSLAGLFWQRLLHEREQGAVRHAIFMAFSAEALQNTQKPGQLSLLDFPFCVPAKRIRFVSIGEAKIAPSHSNVIVYVPGSVDYRSEFERVFSKFGKVRL